VARKIDPKSSNTLNEALQSLEGRKVRIHPALRKAFEKLYGYACDEEGVRHAFINKDDTSVGIDECLFMFSACASFCGYLARKHTQFPIKDTLN